MFKLNILKKERENMEYGIFNESPIDQIVFCNKTISINIDKLYLLSIQFEYSINNSLNFSYYEFIPICYYDSIKKYHYKYKLSEENNELVRIRNVFTNKKELKELITDDDYKKLEKYDSFMKNSELNNKK